MGSVTSRPKMPQAPSMPVIYTVPSAPPPATVAIDGDNQNAGGENAAQKDEAARAQAREKNLLTRSRGAAGTILTGFRGLLSQQAGAQGRKNLLGE